TAYPTAIAAYHPGVHLNKIRRLCIIQEDRAFVDGDRPETVNTAKGEGARSLFDEIRAGHHGINIEVIRGLTVSHSKRARLCAKVDVPTERRGSIEARGRGDIRS